MSILKQVFYLVIILCTLLTSFEGFANELLDGIHYERIRPHAVIQAGTNTYQYDANGNMTSGAGREITWTYYDNMPKTITNGALTISFIYDYANRRVQKTGISTATYVNSGYECVSGSCTLYNLCREDNLNQARFSFAMISCL